MGLQISSEERDICLAALKNPNLPDSIKEAAQNVLDDEIVGLLRACGCITDITGERYPVLCRKHLEEVMAENRIMADSQNAQNEASKPARNDESVLDGQNHVSQPFSPFFRPSTRNEDDEK